MKNIKILLLSALFIFTLNSCVDEGIYSNGDYKFVAFKTGSVGIGVPWDGTTQADDVITVYVSGITSADRLFNIIVDEDNTTAVNEAYSLPSSVMIPANSNEGTISVNVSDIEIGDDGVDLVLMLENGNGYNFVGESKLVNFTRVCPLNEVIFDITFDSYPSETSYKLFDSNGDLVDENDSFSGLSSFSKAFCLTDGTYTFTLYDSYGDGMTGDYHLTYDGVDFFTGGSNFGYSESTTFTVPM